MITKMTIIMTIIISIIEFLVVRFNEKRERGLSYLIGTIILMIVAIMAIIISMIIIFF